MTDIAARGSPHADLYETDYHAWTQAQADALRRRSPKEIDWEHLLEEVESLGKSERRELENRLEILLIHLLKWRHQPERRSRSWANTIQEQRRRIRAILADNPSLKAGLDGAWFAAYEGARYRAYLETGIPLLDFPDVPMFTVEDAMTETLEFDG